MGVPGIQPVSGAVTGDSKFAAGCRAWTIIRYISANYHSPKSTRVAWGNPMPVSFLSDHVCTFVLKAYGEGAGFSHSG